MQRQLARHFIRSSLATHTRHVCFSRSVPLSRTFASYPPHELMGLPALSPTMKEGTLLKWRKKEGEKISAGDVIAEIETDKASMEFEAQEEKWLAKIIVPEGTQGLTVGQTIAITVDEAEDADKFKDYVLEESGSSPAASTPSKSAPSQPSQSDQPAKPAQPAQPSQPSKSSQTSQSSSPSASGVFASPIARVLAAQRGINLKDVKGTGPNGRIIMQDIENYKGLVSRPTFAPSAGPVSIPAPTAGAQASYHDEQLSNIRKVIAQRLTDSKNERPHYYLTIDCRVDNLMKLRAEINERNKGQFKLSVNDFIIKAAALALRDVPEVNSSWNTTSIRRYHNIDINVALNTDRGLLTPLIPNADQKGLSAISAEVHRLAEKGRTSGLSAEESQPGTFTISNLGMFGVKSFTAIINPPQSSILAVGAAEKRLIPAPQTEQGFEMGTFIHFTTSNDHRVLDGATSAQWLAAFRKYIEDPVNMLL